MLDTLIMHTLRLVRMYALLVLRSSLLQRSSVLEPRVLRIGLHHVLPPSVDRPLRPPQLLVANRRYHMEVTIGQVLHTGAVRIAVGNELRDGGRVLWAKNLLDVLYMTMLIAYRPGIAFKAPMTAYPVSI